MSQKTHQPLLTREVDALNTRKEVHARSMLEHASPGDATVTQWRDCTAGIANVYRCHGCGRLYNRRALADQCAAQGLPPPLVSVGDVVLCDRHGPLFHTVPNPEWIAARGPRRHESHHVQGKATLFWVVTAIEMYPDTQGEREANHVFDEVYRTHEWVYHLGTGAYASPGFEPVVGWTTFLGHYSMRPVRRWQKVPQVVHQAAWDWIGKKGQLL